MKSTVNDETKETELPFPKLMISPRGTTVTVLFMKSRCGTVVSGETVTYKLGHYGTDWIMDTFTDLPKGTTVTLSNDD